MPTHQPLRVAAVQLDTDIGNVPRNLERCRQLVLQAHDQGATWIALPEFFNTGFCWKPELEQTIEGPNGQSVRFLQTLSKELSIVIGGSLLCRVSKDSVRNRYFCFSRGRLIGVHDKDLPTMWESTLYEGGDASDTGELGRIDEIRIGSAVCWEFMRTATSNRLKGRIDLLMGGSNWWSIPDNWPRWLTSGMENANRQNSIECVQDTARLIGAPILHAAHCNSFECPMPGFPLRYQGKMEGNTAIIDANGEILALRTAEEGEGVVVADITLGSAPASEPTPTRYWLRKRGLIPAFSWHYHGLLGRRYYHKYIKRT